MVDSIKNSSFTTEDATMKELILNTACRVEAIERLLESTTHLGEHTPHIPLILKSEVEGLANSIKKERPYASAYKSVKREGSASHSDNTYLRAFSRNLIDPS